MQKEIGDFLNKFEKVQRERKDFNNEIDSKTKNYQKKYGFEIGKGVHATWNNESDAFKHAFMQAVLYHRASKNAPIFKDKIGNTYSKVLGDYHETETKETVKGETNMDLWNNEVGREIAKDVRAKLGKAADKLDDSYIEDLIASEIMKRMKKGELITKPSDKRKFGNKNNLTKKTTNKSNNKSFNNKDGHWVTVNGNHVFIEK